MALLKKANIAAPVLPRETVPVAELGGDVVVRGLLFSEKLALFSSINATGQAFAEIPALLASTVLDADDVPVFSVREWEEFGNANEAAVLALFKVARRLSGLDAEATEKN